MTNSRLLTHPHTLPLSPHPTHGRFNWMIGGVTILLWLYLSSPELMGFMHLIQTLSFFNIALLAGAIAVLVLQGIHHRQDWGLSAQPTVQGLPLVVMLGAAIAAVASRWFLDLEQLSVIWFVIGSYGVIGLFCNRRIWQRGLPFMGAFVMLILLLALEFTDLGHLARTLVAEIVEGLLKPFGINAITSEDILVLSTGIAFIDIPCSGFKNIEIGSLFFIAASLLGRRQMGLKWLLVGLLNLALLITANVGRILVIVVLTFVMQQQTLAEIIHVPLGLFGFITVCLMMLQLLRWVPRQDPRQDASPAPSAAPSSAAPPSAAPPPSRPTPSRPTPSRPSRTPSLRSAVLAMSALVGLVLIPSPAHHHTIPDSFHAMQWPAEIHTEPLNFTETEQNFFTRFPGVVAEKQAFQFENVSGSMILVTSPSWQAHHAPEMCFSARGLTIDAMAKQDLTADVTGRWLSLNQGDRQAAYWFQSPQRTTDYYLDRVWSEITRQDTTWTMVSILFDDSVDADNTDVQTILADVHGAIAAAMT